MPVPLDRLVAAVVALIGRALFVRSIVLLDLRTECHDALGVSCKFQKRCYTSPPSRRGLTRLDTVQGCTSHYSGAGSSVGSSIARNSFILVCTQGGGFYFVASTPRQRVVNRFLSARVGYVLRVWCMVRLPARYWVCLRKSACVGVVDGRRGVWCWSGSSRPASEGCPCVIGACLSRPSLVFAG